MRNIVGLWLGVFLLLSACKEDSAVKFRYWDGSGNLYRLENSGEIRLSYEPVTPELSSSGVYSGGSAVSKTLSPRQGQELLALVRKALEKTENHILQRVMMSGMISLGNGDEPLQVILAPQSPEKAQLEKYLSQLLFSPF